MRATLIDGQGNFGSIDNDPPAAMRYTESRLQKLAMAMLEDLDKDTVDFRPNYDEKETEPTVLPSRVPNLIVNGAGGIAVGMATNIPPHNLGETIDGALALMDKPDMTVGGSDGDHPRPGFPDRRPDRRPLRHSLGLCDGPRLDHPARQGAISRASARIARRSSSPRCLIRSTRRRWSSASPNSCAKSASRAFPTCATRAIATASAS